MDLQQGITLFFVGIAAFFLARHLYKSVQAGEGDTCGGCGGCGKPSPKVPGVRTAPKSTPLMTLSTAPPRRKVMQQNELSENSS